MSECSRRANDPATDSCILSCLLLHAAPLALLRSSPFCNPNALQVQWALMPQLLAS